jgi:hypothetical protein
VRFQTALFGFKHRSIGFYLIGRHGGLCGFGGGIGFGGEAFFLGEVLR